MSIEAIYRKGVFLPLEKIEGLKEGEKVELCIEKENFHTIVSSGKSLDFLDNEEDIYSEDDIIEPV